MKEFPFDPYDFFGYLVSGLIILFSLEMTIGVPRLLGQDLKPLDLVFVTLAAYICGQLAANPAQWFLEDLVVRRLLGLPSVNLMRHRASRSQLRRLFPGYFEHLPEAIQERVLANARSEGLANPNGEDLFLHIRFRDYIRNDAALMGRLQSFLNKYGFSRNLCFVALLFSVCVLIVNPFELSSDMTRYGLLSVAAAILLFFRYLKFFRQYSYELFNSYAGKP